MTVKDTTKQTVKLKKIKTVHLGHKTKVQGTVTDLGAVRRVTLSWGDGSKSVKVHLGRRGGFTVRHRYKKAGKFTVKVKATDQSGSTRTKKAKAKVRRR